MKIFISGSASIKCLPSSVVKVIIALIADDNTFLVGDCIGVDTLIQDFLYNNGGYAVVYSSGSLTRNNSHSFPENHVAVPAGLYGRAFYTVKEEKMAKDCDVGIVIWDGSSRGSRANIEKLRKLNKKVAVYVNGSIRVYS